MQCHDWFLTSREEVKIFVPPPLTLYLLRMANVLLEIVQFRMAPGQKPIWPVTILGCTIRGACECHFELGSSALNPLGQGRLWA